MTSETSPLHAEHVADGATMVDFAGWQMPVRYSGDIAEHQAVRTAAGLFDLSHMGELMVRGADAAAALDYAFVGQVSRVPLWGAKYTMMCAPDGGVIDDVIVYRRDWDHFMVVANAANRITVRDQLRSRIGEGGFDASVEDVTHEIALVAIQGPAAESITASMCELGADDIHALKYYKGANVLIEGGIHAFAARTGYTGEDGFELFVPADRARAVWSLAIERGDAAGLMPCGLAARDSLRLEAGMPLYGHELSHDTNPFEAGLGRIVGLGGSEGPPRGDFVGRAALERVRDVGVQKTLVGLAGDGRRSPRTGYPVTDPQDNQIGIVTSGAPSPTLGHPIAMAYVPPGLAEAGTEIGVDVRGRREMMRVVPLPFYTRGG
ncbi:glycine cleavage system aminomethyltransferase GcvT [Demequina sp. SO4-18]|uniref:glycine cleavage system aminomethyltransferase GcvT n=1 Tax=Demequina sp. SO4-18 TaxID=3401026 RepID=UPI003B5CC461